MNAPSMCDRGFPDDDDEDYDDDFGKETPSSHKDGGMSKNGNTERKPATPRSKHSATEQRRRSRINDRFRILRDLIPHSDQKRDKASFLVEGSLFQVIEYIQFLQEKVQKYELLNPGWSPDNARMPWKTSHTHGDSIVDPVKHTPVSTNFIFPADRTISGVPAVLSNTQKLAESENLSSGLASKSASMPIPMQYPAVGADTEFSQPQERLVSDSGNMATQPQARWPRSYATDSGVSSGILNGQEELVIDEGTISLSSMYSDRLLTTLTQALQSSGIDLSQASISVQINLGRRSIGRPMSRPKDQDGPLSSNRLAGLSEDANKRPRSDTS